MLLQVVKTILSFPNLILILMVYHEYTVYI